jgi:hypothetical protein
VPISKELRKQIELCQKMLMSFQQRGDAKSVLLYEALLSRTQDDYKRLQDAIVGNSGTPKYQIKEINLPIVESNPEVPDDGLELKISLSNVKLPEVLSFFC